MDINFIQWGDVGGGGEASPPNSLASPAPKNLTLIKLSIIKSLAFENYLKEYGRIKEILLNISQGTWRAEYAHSFISLPPQIFVTG